MLFLSMFEDEVFFLNDNKIVIEKIMSEKEK